MKKKKISASVSEVVNNPNSILVDKKNIEEKLTNNDWSTMENYFNELSQMIANISLSFNEIIKVATYNLQSYMTEEEIKQIEILSKGFASDVNNIITDLVKVHKSHKKFSGKPSDDSEEFFFLISTMESYMSIYDKTMAILPITVANATEIVGDAQSRLEKSLEASKGEVNV